MHCLLKRFFNYYVNPSFYTECSLQGKCVWKKSYENRKVFGVPTLVINYNYDKNSKRVFCSISDVVFEKDGKNQLVREEDEWRSVKYSKQKKEVAV